MKTFRRMRKNTVKKVKTRVKEENDKLTNEFGSKIENQEKD